MLFLLSSAITKLRQKLGPKNTRPLRQSHNAMRYKPKRLKTANDWEKEFHSLFRGFVKNKGLTEERT